MILPIGDGATLLGSESFDAEDLDAFECGWRSKLTDSLTLDIATCHF